MTILTDDERRSIMNASCSNGLVPMARALEAAVLAKLLGQEPVAWCFLTPSGKIGYFDGKPMLMVGPMGNEHHTTPLFPYPASQPAVVQIKEQA